MSGTPPQQPLARVLIDMRTRELTGRLEARESNGSRTTLYFKKGCVVQADRPDALDKLAVVLQQSGLVPARALAELGGPTADDGTLVQAMLARGVPAERVREALRLQLRRKIARLFFAEQAAIDVLPGEHRFSVDGGAMAVEVDPRYVVLQGIRAAYDDDRLSRELAVLVGRTVRMGTAGAELLREAALPGNEDPTMARLCSGGLLIDPAFTMARGDRKVTAAKALVLALHYLGLLDTQTRSSGALAPLAPARASVTVAPPARTSVPVVPLAPVPAAPVAPVAPEPGGRKRTGITGLELLDLDTIGRTAEAFFKNGDLARAENAFILGLQSSANNPRFRAFLAWIRYWKPDADRTAAAAEVIATAKEAVAKDPQFAYGHLFLGMMHKQGNDLGAAERAFRNAIAADENLHEAHRELRLIAMRKGKPTRAA